MKKMTVIKTCVFAIAAIGLCVLGSSAQEEAGYATLSGRPIQRTQQPTYTQRQIAAQKATYNAQQAYSRAVAPNVRQTSFANGGCAETGCATGGCSTGCGESVGCNVAAPMPVGGCATGGCGETGCATEGCATAGCGDNGCATDGCRTGSCPPNGCSPAPGQGGWAQARRSAWDNNCDTGNGCGPDYRSGYNKRMGRLLGGKGQSCGGSKSCNTSKDCFWTRSSRSYQNRNARLSQHLFGWMIPSGHGGQGSPPIGYYHTTYAQDANHFDQRDGGVYAAQGYGTNVTVPLAPNVRHAYNYGWGMPSSRITRVSTVAPYTTLRPLHW